MNAAKLKQLVEAVEAVERDIKKMSDHKRDILKAHTSEFDPKAVRKVIARRKIDAGDRDSEDFLVHSYEVALGMAGNLAQEVVSGGKTYDEAAKELGVSRRTVARQVARARGVPKATDNGTPAHDADTGEIIEETADRKPLGGERVRAETEAASGPLPATPATTDDAWAAADEAHAAFLAAKRAKGLAA